MAKGIYVGIGGTAHKTKPYVGIDGVARKVKKVYVGVDGLPRLAFSTGIEYGGTATNLTYAAQSSAVVGGHNSAYAIFGLMQLYSGVVDAYNSNVVKATSPANLSVARLQGACAVVGEKVLIGGGYNDSDSATRDIQGYDNLLVRTSTTSLPTAAWYLAAASSASSAIFLGGIKSKPSSTDVYTPTGASVNASLAVYTGISCPASSPGLAISFAGNAVFAFNSGIASSDCFAYKSDNTKLYVGPFAASGKQVGPAAVVDNTYLLVSQGYPATDSVAVYNSAFVKVSTVPLSAARRPASYTFLEYGIFGFGKDAAGNNTNLIEYFDTQLVRDSFTAPNYRNGATGVQIGNNLILASGSYTNTVEYFTI